MDYSPLNKTKLHWVHTDTDKWIYTKWGGREGSYLWTSANWQWGKNDGIRTPEQVLQPWAQPDEA